MAEEQRDVVVALAQSLKVGTPVLRALTQHMQDVALLTREVVELRARVANLQALHVAEQVHRAVFQKRLEAIEGKTDAMGFGKRMV